MAAYNMKILVLVSRVPWPLEKGDKLRAFYQIKSLAKHHEVILCALNADGSDTEAAEEHLRPFCTSIHFFPLSKLGMLFSMARAFLTGKPIQCGYFYNKTVHAQIRSIIAETRPDAVYGQLVRVALYLEDQPVCKAIDYQDALSAGMKRRRDIASFVTRPIYAMEYRRLKAYETKIFDTFDVKTIISEADRKLIDHPQADTILIVPNGVDTDHYAPRHDEPQYDLIFSGNMAYPPNVNAVEYLTKDILPIVRNTIPNVTVCLAGATPTPSVKAVASGTITVTGWVDDMRDMYACSRVFIAPMRIGTGLQNKLLEAMAMNIPCITTPIANNALRAAEGSEVCVGKTAEELAAHIVRLLNDQEYAKTVADAGTSFVNRTYDWDAATKILEDAIEEKQR